MFVISHFNPLIAERTSFGEGSQHRSINFSVLYFHETSSAKLLRNFAKLRKFFFLNVLFPTKLLQEKVQFIYLSSAE